MSDPDPSMEARFRDEIEQLRTTLESSLDENARLIEDRDRLLGRVTMLSRELQSVRSGMAQLGTAPAPKLDVAEAETRQGQAEEELRVAFEELQVLTEELEVANTSLHETNAQLEGRVHERTLDLENANTALRSSEAAFRTLVTGIPQLVWRSLDHGDWTWSSPQWTDYTGQSQEDSAREGWLQALHPDDRPTAKEAWERAGATGELEFKARIYHVRKRRHCHFHTRATPLFDDSGLVVEWLGTSTDVDEMMQLQQRQAVLVEELQHRTRNLMAVVQAVMLRTLKGSKTLEGFRRCIEDRMQALARAQGLLSRRGTGKVTFDELLFEELSAHVELDSEGCSEQVTARGPRGLALQSSNVQTLALAIHELATNASKYGALRDPDGRLDVHWRLISEGLKPELRLEWTERGVKNMPASIDAPQGGGYGRELIERALPYQMGARTSYVFAEDGIRCTIEIGVSTVDAAEGEQHA